MQMEDFLLESLRIALITLRYGGLATIAFGAVLWGISKKSTAKNKRGIWMIYTGAFMFIIYVSWGAFMAFISYFTDVGHLYPP
jgi:hypothetical protein